MKDVPENVNREVLKLIPASLTNDITCFVFYDNHPKGNQNIDITICTKYGEVKEFFQRDLLSSINLECTTKAKEIKIKRNDNLELCYLVSTDNELYIISSKNSLQILKKITNVQMYDFNDAACSGLSSLRVIKSDDAVPLLFDNNFESLENDIIISNDALTYPVLSKLQQKYVETKYTTKSNEDTLRQYLEIRQKATLLISQNLHPNLNDSAFKDDSIDISGELKLKSTEPHVTVCNNKLLIILEVVNGYEQPIEEVHILLSTATHQSIVYATKIFTKLPTSPYWKENTSNSLKPNQENAIVAIMNLEEIKHNVTSRIELTGVISYKMSTKEFLMPFHDVLISSIKSMVDEFDVLFNNGTDSLTSLAMLSSTQQTELRLRHIKNQAELDLTLAELFCVYLQMEKLSDNVVVYRRSPYHVLNGVMVVFGEGVWNDKIVPVWVHTMSPSQILALVHCIDDAIPSKIIATTPNYNVTAKNEEYSQYSDAKQIEPKYNYKEYARSTLIRSKKVLEFLNNSMRYMNQSKTPKVQLGIEIDLFAGGIENFKDFKKDIMDETKKGIDCLLKCSDSDAPDSSESVMIID